MKKLILSGLVFICFISFVSAELSGNYSIPHDAYVYAGGGDGNTGSEPTFHVGIHNSIGFLRAYVYANLSNLSGRSIDQVLLTLRITDTTGVDGAHVNEFYYCNDGFDESTITWNNQGSEVTNCNATFFYSQVQQDITDDTWITLNISLAPEVQNDADGIFTIKMIVNPESGSVRRRWEMGASEHTTTSYQPYFMVNSSEGGGEPGNPPPAMVKSLYNHSTAKFNIVGDNSTVWRVDTNITSTTSDSTPTIIAGTDVASNCRMGITDDNYTTLGYARNCTQLAAQNVSCSLTAGDALLLDSEDNSLFIGCIESTGGINETVNSTSGPLNVTLDLYILNGTVLTTNDDPLEDVVIILINQTSNTAQANTTTNASGEYLFELVKGIWDVIARNITTTTNGEIFSHVVVP